MISPNIALKDNGFNNKISFKAMSDPQVYNKHYGYNSTHNGKVPDEYILNKLNEYFPNPKNVKVLDIGAGEGRNALPIAKNGYKVTTYETSNRGCDNIFMKAR